MTASIALQICLICAGIIALILWLASPTGRPWDGEDCRIEGCKWHGRGRR